MKEIFKNQTGFNTAKINVSTATGDIDLFYDLSDNPVQHIWQDIHLKSNKIINGRTSGLNYDKVVAELDSLCRLESVEPLTDSITQDKLNELHHKYVNSNHNNNWLKINELIHVLETKIDNPFSEYDFSVNFYSNNTNKYPIKESYKLFLESDAIWGRLVLGYATLGKDWLVIPNNDDNRDDLELQSYITSETYLSFSVEDPFPCYREIKLYNWANNKNFYVPLDNLNALNFGRYYLGQLIITEELLQFHNNYKDWYIPNHRCKLDFNKKVLGNKLSVNSINFLDSDIAYKQFCRHSDFYA
jgi:hypothetical protein